MKAPKTIELCPLWDRGAGRMRSAPLMDDAIQELVRMAREGPLLLFVKPREKRGNPKAADAVLLAIPLGKR